MKTTCVLVTGGAGFIGGEFVRQMVGIAKHSLVVVDRLNYAARLDGISEAISGSNATFVQGDIRDRRFVEGLLVDFPINIVVNFAAESHVDRSITSPLPFLEHNLVGTAELLEATRLAWQHRHVRGRWIQVSTDEVYGSLEPNSNADETAYLNPTSPYSASKAAADLWIQAYGRTFGVPILVTRSVNNYGPYQYPEKLIPRLVRKALEGEPLPIFGNGLQIREWIHVADHCRALVQLLHQGKAGEVYNIGSGVRVTNLAIAESVIKLLQTWIKNEGRPPLAMQIEQVEDRQAHDRYYGLKCEKLREEIDWSCEVDFRAGLGETVKWLANDYSRQAK